MMFQRICARCHQPILEENRIGTDYDPHNERYHAKYICQCGLETEYIWDRIGDHADPREAVFREHKKAEAS